MMFKIFRTDEGLHSLICRKGGSVVYAYQHIYFDEAISDMKRIVKFGIPSNGGEAEGFLYYAELYDKKDPDWELWKGTVEIIGKCIMEVRTYQ